MNPQHSYPIEAASKARFDGTSIHEERAAGRLASVTYSPDGSTTLTYADGSTLVATGYGRRVQMTASGETYDLPQGDA